MEGGSGSREEEPWLKLGLPNTEDWPLKQKSKRFAADTALPSNIPHKRTTPAAVVGWPPIRSFRKNISSTTSQAKASVSEPQHAASSSKLVYEKSTHNSKNGKFVKINMDGVPIGRKVNLKAYDSYGQLSAAVDELFRGLLAAQKDSISSDLGIHIKPEEQKPITGLLDGRGDYTLVYEDYEGDSLLVGDVPWQLFVSSVKRLRVLKSSDLSVLSLAGGKQENQKLSDLEK